MGATCTIGEVQSYATHGDEMRMAVATLSVHKLPNGPTDANIVAGSTRPFIARRTQDGQHIRSKAARAEKVAKAAKVAKAGRADKSRD